MSLATVSTITDEVVEVLYDHKHGTGAYAELLTTVGVASPQVESLRSVATRSVVADIVALDALGHTRDCSGTKGPEILTKIAAYLPADVATQIVERITARSLIR